MRLIASLARSVLSSRRALLIAALASTTSLAMAEADQAQDKRRDGGERRADVDQRPNDRGPEARAPGRPDSNGRSFGERGPREGGPPSGGFGRPDSQGFRPQGRGPGGPGGGGFGGRGFGGGGFGSDSARPEMRMQMMSRVFPLMAALDANRDGVISESEIAGAAAALKKLDRNRDGKLTAEELRPDMSQRGGQGMRPGGPEGRGPEGRGPEGRGPEGRGPEGRGPEGRGPEGRGPEGRGPEGRGPEGSPRPEFAGRMFEARDQNKDGVLRGDEIPQQLAERLERIDQNGDAAISREEMKKAMERMRGAGQGGQRPSRGPGGQEDRGPRPGGDVPKRPASDN